MTECRGPAEVSAGPFAFENIVGVSASAWRALRRRDLTIPALQQIGTRVEAVQQRRENRLLRRLVDPRPVVDEKLCRQLPPSLLGGNPEKMRQRRRTLLT